MIYNAIIDEINIIKSILIISAVSEFVSKISELCLCHNFETGGLVTIPIDKIEHDGLFIPLRLCNELKKENDINIVPFEINQEGFKDVIRKTLKPV